MQSYWTPDETAKHLKVEVQEVMSLIEQGKMKAIRIGQNIRIPESEIESLEVTCSAFGEPDETGGANGQVAPELPVGARWVTTMTGKAKFRVSGSVADGAQIWPGQMRHPIKFPRQFMGALLAHFCGKEVRIGGKFDDPGSGSLGEFIQQQLNIKMNPAVYLAALLIEEGHALRPRRGRIRFRAS